MSLPITAEREVRGVDETIKDGIGDCRVTEHRRILQFLIGP
jgi:hypothetical protein